MHHSRWSRLALSVCLLSIAACSSTDEEDQLAPSPGTLAADTLSGDDATASDAASSSDDVLVPDSGPSEDADALADADPGTDAETEDTGENDTDEPDVSEDAGVAPIVVPTGPGCDDTNPLMCILPFPSDRYLAPDPSTATGYRLALESLAMPESVTGSPFDTSPFEKLDGVSPASHFITLFEEPADLSDAAFHDSIDLSLESDHPTVVIDRTTGELVPHWVENDARADNEAETLLYIRPADPLKPNRSYAVAIRGLNGLSGAPLPASAAFAALRDGVPTTADSIESRRETFEDLFEDLEDAGVERESLQAAWTFHTGTYENIRQTLLAMRDDAVDELGPDGLGCTVTEVKDDHHGLVRRVRGTFTVPWYMSTSEPPGVIVRDDDTLPVHQGTEEVAFTALVPHTVINGDAPAQLITWGHGLFGDADKTISNQKVAEVASESEVVIVATDWEGMSQKNLGFLANALLDASLFFQIGEWLQQGMVNQVSLTRNMMGDCRLLPAMARLDGQPAIDPTDRVFIGGSQGSILGATLLTISPDMDRGALMVGGANFSFMIERSIHYNTFGVLLDPAYPSRLARAVVMILSQHVWDNAETVAWIGAAAEGLDGIGPKEFLYLIAENDAQVSNLTSDIAVRLSDIPVLEGSVRVPWGTTATPGPITGSAFVSMDVGDPEVPPTNISPPTDAGGHGSVSFTPEATSMIVQFLNTGIVNQTCDGDCDLTD